MATRDDITVLHTLSPRVAELAAPATSISMQDVVDTLRVEEMQFQSMGYPRLLTASGKEDLGDGLIVAITVAEQDVRLKFEGRTTPAETGTVTTGSGPPNAVGRQTFTDTAADFDAANVEPGSLVINFTDRSIADVVQKIDSDTLETKTLVNGVTNEYNVTDIYHVFNIIQCRTFGGNLTAVDDLDATINAILPSAFTQVIVQLSSANTITNLTDIEADIATILAQTTASAQSAAVWDALISAHSVSGSFGEFIVRRLLTVAKFFALK